MLETMVHKQRLKFVKKYNFSLKPQIKVAILFCSANYNCYKIKVWKACDGTCHCLLLR
jgi:hypothetical protein